MNGCMPHQRIERRRTVLSTTDGTDVFDLQIRRMPVIINGCQTSPITLNGSVPVPLIRLREGREVVLRVTNHLQEDASIH